jgi:glycosyltransferase involved in cell wall biosynthesis
MLHLPTQRVSIIESVDTYNAIWANSEYTKSWIKRYWDRESDVLYPPVDVDRFRPSTKRHQILTVGRFFSGSHNKKHLEMVAAFRQMVDQGLEGWSFHLAGGSSPGKEHIDYLDRVRAESEGYPIEIHPDLSFTELARLYSESAIYWHAAGLGEDEEREPAKFEHFGITTVEAMAAGCVPVVIAKGGQPEIVQNGKDGFLWDTITDFKSSTRRLISNPDLMESMASQATQRSQNYDMKNFISRLKTLLMQLPV